MSLIPKEILLTHLQRAEGADSVSLPIEFFRDLIYQAMPKQEQGEPVAWMKPDALCDRSCMYVCTEGFTKFPECATKNEWVGLTDGDFVEACQIAERGNYLVAFKRIQEKLKEKNNG
jgi:hypothetical protein